MELLVSVVSADPAVLLERISSGGVKLRDATSHDGLEVRFCIAERDLDTVKQIADRRGDSLVVLERNGVGLYLRSIVKRWVLLGLCIVMLLLSVWIPQHILFVTVEGNGRISDREILLAAEECGLFFGADRSGVRSVQIKNYLLERLPGLGWACVNTKGCVATIKVLEKTESDTESGLYSAVTDIVSAVDGVIIEQQVRAGFPKQQIGQAVRMGQVLVSGTQEDGVLERYVRPDADIYAVTYREFSANLQTEGYQKAYAEETRCFYSLLFGKNQIKFMKDSRIYTTECDKMYEEYYITLPGGYCLPFGIAIETVRPYDLVAVDASDSSVQEAHAALERYLYEQMISGRVVGCNTVQQSDARITVCYQCTEMIGRESERKYEVSYGKND